jgi:hypothetical protein
MPGRLLTCVAAVICGEHTRTHVMEPLLADLQRDWCERPHDASGVRRLLSGYCAFWMALAVSTARDALKDDGPGLAPRTRDALVAYAIAAVTPVLLHLAGFGGRLADDTFGDALPAIGYGSAFALLPAMMRARGSAGVEWRRGATRIFAAGGLTAVLVMGWIQPALLHLSMARRVSPAQQPYYASFEPITNVAVLAVGSADPAIRAAHVHFLEFEALLVGSALVAAAFGWVLAGLVRPTPVRTAAAWFVVTELVVTHAYAVPPLWTQSWPLWMIASAAVLLQIVGRQRSGVALVYPRFGR